MSTLIKLSFDRPFQLWSYVVSHNQLLLRSTKSAQANKRIDVLFKNVALINIEPALDSLAIEEIAPSEVQLNGTHVLLKNRKVFRIAARNFIGYVVAGAVFSHEDEGEYHERSALLPM